MDLQPNTANFPHRGFFLFCFEIYYLFGCEFGLFSSAKQKMPYGGKKVRHARDVRFQVHQQKTFSSRLGTAVALKLCQYK